MTLFRLVALTHALALVLLAALMHGRPQRAEARRALDAAQAQGDAERVEVASLPGLEAEVQRLETTWKDERQTLPDAEGDRAIEGSLQESIEAACNANAVTRGKLMFSPGQRRDLAHDFEPVEVSVSLEGVYDGLVRVVAALESRTTWTEVVELSIGAKDGAPKGILAATLTVRTYRPPAR